VAEVTLQCGAMLRQLQQSLTPDVKHAPVSLRPKVRRAVDSFELLVDAAQTQYSPHSTGISLNTSGLCLCCFLHITKANYRKLPDLVLTSALLE
jgi:hypothetical protein